MIIRIAASVVLAMLLFTFVGCWRKGANGANAGNNANANADSVAAGQFDNITDPEQALAEGNRLLDENDIEPAIAALKRAITLNPDLAEAHFKLGIAYALQEMKDLQQGESIDDTKDAKGQPAKTRSEKEFEKAAEAYNKWIDANPKDDLAEYNLGRTYAKLNKDEDAEKAFRAAVKLKPDDTEYQTELGAVLIKLAKYQEAVGVLKKALDLDSENVRAQELMDDAKAGRQRLDYAVQKMSANSNGNNNSRASSNANVASANSNTASPTNTAADRPRIANTKPTAQPTRKPPIGNRP